MKRFFSFCLVLLVGLLLGACTTPTPTTSATTSADQVVPAGFSADVHAVYANGRGQDSARWPTPQPLFARDLSNADQAPGAWAFNVDGVLAPTRAADAPANGDLWTKASYGDFVVSLEFRTKEKSHSGVFLRTTDITAGRQPSLKVQIAQGDEDSPVHQVGAIYEIAAPARQVAITPGEWYRYVITAKGNKLTVMLNGEEVNKVDLDQVKDAGKNLARAGRIGLQDHGQPIEFRNLLVEEL